MITKHAYLCLCREEFFKVWVLGRYFVITKEFCHEGYNVMSELFTCGFLSLCNRCFLSLRWTASECRVLSQPRQHSSHKSLNFSTALISYASPHVLRRCLRTLFPPEVCSHRYFTTPAEARKSKHRLTNRLHYSRPATTSMPAVSFRELVGFRTTSCWSACVLGMTRLRGVGCVIKVLVFVEDHSHNVTASMRSCK